MHNIYTQFSTVVLRTPSFSLNYFKQLIASKTALEEFCRKDDFQEAIYLASPELYNEMQKWREGGCKDDKESEKLKQSLYRYLARMSTRSTPFGLFAGLTAIKLRKKNSYQESQNNKENKRYRVTRPDMNFTCALGQKLSKQSEIKSQLKFFPNNSIYQSSDKLRYVEYTYGAKSKRIHQVTAIDKNAYVERILERASQGALVEEMAKVIVEDDIAFSEATDFVSELIDSQLLVSELEPSITEPDYWGFLIKKLEAIKGAEVTVAALKEVKDILIDLDNKPVGANIANYYWKIKEILSQFEVSFEEKYLFQTDMLLSDEYSGLDDGIAHTVLEGMDIMNKLSVPPRETNITKFASEFHKRYEDREVSLLKVLDPEAGIGYPINRAIDSDISPLLNGLALPGKPAASSQINWDGIQLFLLKKYQESLKNNDFTVELTSDKLKGFKAVYSDLPATISAMVQLLPPEKEKGEDRILLGSVGGNSALCLIGRFCHTSEKLHTHAKKIAQKEMELANNALVAEVLHLPEARTGNILMHPKFYDYEIPFLAQSSVAKSYTIELSDLMVSVRQNRVFLRSKSLNKQILPRLSNAHNFSFNSLPVYRFLSDLQLQGKRGGVGFSWGAFTNEYSFLPRVTYKNLIFSLATWNVRKKDIEHLLGIKENKELLKAVNAWCNENRIPQWITLVDGDNELAIDTTSVLSIKTLLNLVKKRSGFKIQEFLHNPETTPVKNSKGESFANQVILSFYKNKN